MRRRIAPSERGTPISWQDIDAFCRLTKTHITPLDIQMIETLDDLFLAQAVKGASEQDKQRFKKDGLLALGRRES